MGICDLSILSLQFFLRLTIMFLIVVPILSTNKNAAQISKNSSAIISTVVINAPTDCINFIINETDKQTTVSK